MWRRTRKKREEVTAAAKLGNSQQKAVAVVGIFLQSPQSLWRMFPVSVFGKRH